MSNLNLFMKDVAFAIQKKRGFPKLKDEGLVDVLVTGGLNFLTLRWVVQADRGRPLYFRLANVTSSITRVKPTFTSARHKGMLNAMTAMSAGTLKNRVNFTIEERIIGFFDRLDARLNEMAAMRWENSRVSWLKKPIKMPKTGGLFGFGKNKGAKSEVKEKKNKLGRKIQQFTGQTGAVTSGTGMEQQRETYQRGMGPSPATTSTSGVDLGHAQPHVFVGSGTPSESNRGLHIVPQRSNVVSTPYSSVDEFASPVSPASSSLQQPISSDRQIVSRPSELDIGGNQASLSSIGKEPFTSSLGTQPSVGSSVPTGISSASDLPSSGTGGIVVDSPRTMSRMTQEPIKSFTPRPEEAQPSTTDRFQVAPSSSS